MIPFDHVKHPWQDPDLVDGAEDFKIEVIVVDAPAFGRDGACLVKDIAAEGIVLDPLGVF